MQNMGSVPIDALLLQFCGSSAPLTSAAAPLVSPGPLILFNQPSPRGHCQH